MKKRILFITANIQNFLVTAMIKNMERENYEVVHAEPDIVELQLMSNMPDIFIVYLEGDLNAFNGTLKYLKHLIAEEGTERVLYLIGTPQEIEVAYEVIPRSFVSATFSRPVNVSDIISKLNIIVDDEFNGKKRILVVDDDAMLLRTMNNWLSKKYEVFMANSGMNAISFLSKNRVDLILLDYEMPVASGLQVFEMLKSEDNTKNIPVIFLTAKDDKDTVMKVLSAKPEKYLLKTLPPEDLLKSIGDFFKGK